MLRGALGGVVAAIVIGVAVAGCGGGGTGTDTGASGSASVTKAQFVKQAGAICETARKKKEAELQAGRKKLNAKQGLTAAEEEELITTAVLPPLETMVKQLRAVELPEQGAEGAESVAAAFERAVSETKSEPAKALGSESPMVEADEVAKKFGLEACAVF